MGHFPQFGSYLLKKTNRIFINFFTRNVYLDMEVPITCWKPSGLGSGLRIKTGSASAEVCALASTLIFYPAAWNADAV